MLAGAFFAFSLWVAASAQPAESSRSQNPPTGVTMVDTESSRQQPFRADGCPPSMTPIVCRVYQLTNEVRIKNQLPPFKAYKNCSESARTHAEYMAGLSTMGLPLKTRKPGRKEALNHDFFKQRNERFKILGKKKAENVAAGNYAAPEAVLEAWMTSPGHRANILDPDFNAIGLGQAVDKRGLQFWAQCFAQLEAADLAPTSSSSP